MQDAIKGFIKIILFVITIPISILHIGFRLLINTGAGYEKVNSVPDWVVYLMKDL